MQGAYFMTMVLAKSPQDVCRQLAKSNFVWRITELGRFSTPADAATAQAMADAGLIDLNCNTLIPVPFSQYVDCLQFNLSGDEVIEVGAEMKVYDAFFSYEGTGGFAISGAAEVPEPNAIGEGGFHIGGSASVSSSQYHYVGSGGIHISGSATNTSTQFNYAGSGGIDVGGGVENTSTQFNAEGSGGFDIGGAGESAVSLSFEANGLGTSGPTFAGIQLSGSAVVTAKYYFVAEGSGGIHIGGSGIGASSQFNTEGSGGIHIGGEVLTTSPNQYFAGTGGFDIGGSAESTFGLAESGSGGFSITGSAETTISIPAIGSGGVHMGGEALTNRFVGSGGMHIGGSAEVNSSWKGEYIDEAGLEAVCLSFSPTFGTGNPSTYVPTVSTVNVCGARGIPTNLQVIQNFSGSKLLDKFLSRNGLTFPNVFKLSYKRSSGTWAGNYHYRGAANDVSSEHWSFAVEFGCVSDAYGLAISPVWKFVFNVLRANENTGLNFDTRIVTYFDPEPLATYFNRNGVDLNLSLNPKSKVLNILSSNAVAQEVSLFDGIGLFNPSVWGTKDFQFRLKLVGAFSQTPGYDIFPIFPKPTEYAVAE